jgi:hypothetical protein
LNINLKSNESFNINLIEDSDIITIRKASMGTNAEHIEVNYQDTNIVPAEKLLAQKIESNKGINLYHFTVKSQVFDGGKGLAISVPLGEKLENGQWIKYISSLSEKQLETLFSYNNNDILTGINNTNLGLKL